MRERKRACASLPTLDQNSGESGKAAKLVDNKWVWRKKGNSKPGETLSKKFMLRKQWSMNSIWQRVRNNGNRAERVTAGDKRRPREGDLYPLIERRVSCLEVDDRHHCVITPKIAKGTEKGWRSWWRGLEEPHCGTAKLRWNLDPPLMTSVNL